MGCAIWVYRAWNALILSAPSPICASRKHRMVGLPSIRSWRRPAAPPKPHLSACGGAGSRERSRRPELTPTTAAIAVDCQSFLAPAESLKSIERQSIAAASVGDSFDTTACLVPGSSPSLSGRVGVKRFQTTPSMWCGMSLAGSSLLFGIDTLALP